MLFYTYILFSASLDKFYIGSTGDSLIERIRKHNTNHGGFTARANDWELLYSEEFLDKTLALKREKEIKSWKSRKRIQCLIQSAK